MVLHLSKTVTHCSIMLLPSLAEIGPAVMEKKKNIQKVYDEQRTRERQTMDTFLSEKVAWAFGIEQLHRLFTNFFEIYVRRHLYAFNYHDCTIQQACMIIAKDGVFFLIYRNCITYYMYLRIANCIARTWRYRQTKLENVLLVCMF